MENKLKNLSRIECINLHGGDCGGCNDSFWARLGKSVGNAMKRYAEKNTYDTNDPRFKFK